MIFSQFFSILTFVLSACVSNSDVQKEKLDFAQLPKLQVQDQAKREYTPSQPHDAHWFTIAAVGEVRGEIFHQDAD